MADKLHPSHVTRVSMDASSYDEVCVNCGATDKAIGGWGELAKPCPKAPAMLTPEERAYRRGALQALEYVLEELVGAPAGHHVHVLARWKLAMEAGRDSLDPSYLGKYLDEVRARVK